MRKTRTAICSRIFLLFTAASFLQGCSASYNGERLFWHAQRRATQALGSNPAGATSEQFGQAIEAFDRVVRRSPGTAWAARAQLAIATLHAQQRDYVSARQTYDVILRNYGQYRDLGVSARLAIAKLYEVEQNWDAAQDAYWQLAEVSPWSPAGLEAPLYVAATFVKEGRAAEATAVFDKAIKHYTGLIQHAPTPEAVLHVKAYLALAYQRLGRWNEAAAVLEELAKATSGVNRPLVLRSLGTIYETKLHDTAKAQATYQALTEEFPNHQFGQAAKTRLEHLGIAILPQPSAAAPAAPAR